ncbi:hypothetical protein QNE60_004989 [Vibrio harveyi]|nr:hypothetical protein [Vibrio harveyi]
MKKMFKQVFVQFLEEERDLILSDVSERCLCGRLAIPIETAAQASGYKQYKADIEYNRNFGGSIKTVLDDDFKEIKVTCDLILHSRGVVVKQDNLIAVEMKKSYRSEASKNSDRDRLRALTKPTYDSDSWSNDGKTLPEHVCGYLLGVFIDIDLANRLIDLEYYKNGNFSSKESIQI